MSIAIPILFIVVAAIIGMPIWLAFLVGMIPYFGFLEPMMPAQIIMQQFIKNAESASLLAIPLFVTSGVIMNYAGLSRRLMDFADAVCGHLSGGLAHVNVVLSVLQGGCSGSAAADAAVDCKILKAEALFFSYNKCQQIFQLIIILLPAQKLRALGQIVSPFEKYKVAEIFLAQFVQCPLYRLCRQFNLQVVVFYKVGDAAQSFIVKTESVHYFPR